VQTAHVLPLAFGLVPDGHRAAVAERLVRDIVDRRAGHAFVGVIGATYVLPVLTATGHHDVAVAVATKTDEPSWGYWTDTLGFTALGESWPADTRSRNHHFFGAIVQWFYEELAGIRPLEPGYAAIEYKPAIPSSGLDRVSASHESVRGTVACEWRRTVDSLALDVVVPANARGRVHVPAPDGQDVREVGSGTSVAADSAPGVTGVRRDRGHIVYEVGSGRYEFRVGRAR
jgi:alpha-L-rhamnosidase